MKCQKCNDPATFHITELTSGPPVVLHLCANCAKAYLDAAEEHAPEAAPAAVAQPEPASTSADEPVRCPNCGISYSEFSQAGRLGCPHDYVVFEKEMAALLLNAQGATEHTGKRPRRAAHDSDAHSELIRLRREMSRAVAEEDYERASQVRDRIRELEKQLGPS